ncbi:MAG: hypothetical protein JWO72_1207 [Caulobacteraceae bacterium]|nr:hypothetical protein [Caulobacteraceae bacterium]
MTDRLDHLVTRLAAAPTDRALDDFGAEVSRAIARRRMQAHAALALAPVGVASIVVALAMGVTVGSMTAAAAPSAGSNTFSIAADLAPSTLLEGAR